MKIEIYPSQVPRFSRKNLIRMKMKRISWTSSTSKILSVLILVFVVLIFNDEAAAQEYDYDAKPVKPLEISDKDITLIVGSSDTVFLYPTDVFSTSFENETDVTLQFSYSVPGVIAPLPNLTLVANSQPVFQNTTIAIDALVAGRVTVSSVLVPPMPQSSNVSVTNIFLRVAVFKYSSLITISEIVGWMYFLAWSISFYPQIYQNWKRKSVRGLSLDFVFLNITGFFVYAVFNVGIYWFPQIQQEYLTRYPTGVIPVQLNDVIFSLHAVFATAVTATQCIIYDKGSQTVSGFGRTLLMGILIFLFVMLIVALSNNAISWLTFITVCSYVKLFITLIKYIPQAYLNWSRKSTSGWSIGNVLLDLTGGIFSLLQMFIIGFNHNDWTSIFGDLTKFGLGFFSICFDLFFILQHYYLYRNHDAYEPIDGSNIPTIDVYEDMVTSNHVIGEGDLGDDESSSS